MQSLLVKLIMFLSSLFDAADIFIWIFHMFRSQKHVIVSRAIEKSTIFACIANTHLYI